MAGSRISVLIVEARFYEDIADEMLKGAKAAIEAAGGTATVIGVPGALEIPTALEFHLKGCAGVGGDHDAYVALGCVIRGETTHHEHVGRECMQGLSRLAHEHLIALGNGVLTCETVEQAWARARIDGHDKGGVAARAALHMMNLRKTLYLAPRGVHA